MSKLQISQLNSTSLTTLNNQEISSVVGGWFGTNISRSGNYQLGLNLSSINQSAGGGYYYGGGSNSAYVYQNVRNSIG
jgi:hypothetical protein